MALNRTVSRIQYLEEQLRKLEKLQESVDPASGITVHIYRGVEGTEERNPDVQLQTGEFAQNFLSAARTSLLDSLSINRAFARNEYDELRKALGEDK